MTPLAFDRGKYQVRDNKNRVCPVERAGSLDNHIRRWLHNPVKILGPYIKERMKVLDLGCGPGFFSLDIAQMVGKFGKVIACDLQEGMLQKIRAKIHGTELEERITLHQCQETRIGVSGNFDFALAFYMVHEIPNQRNFFREINTLLKSQGQVLVVEPPFHISKNAFEETIRTAIDSGFVVVERPRVLFSKAVILQKV